MIGISMTWFRSLLDIIVLDVKKVFSRLHKQLAY